MAGQRPIFLSRLACAGLVLSLLGGCGPQRFDDPVAAVLDRDLAFRFRRQAIQQAQLEHPGDPRWIAALYRLVSQPGYPTWQRRYAIDQLVEIEPDRFRQHLINQIPRIQSWEALELVLGVVAKQQWVGLTPAVVHSYGRVVEGVPDQDRPERQAIEQLHPGRMVADVAFDVFVGQQGGRAVRPVERVAAWVLLNRLLSRPQLLAKLDQVPDTSALVVDLKAAVTQLGVVPATREQVLWLQSLRTPNNQARWQRYTDHVARLSDEQRRGLEMRHLAVLDRLDPAVLGHDTHTLRDRVGRRLAATPHHTTTPRPVVKQEGDPQLFERWGDRLCWSDLAWLDWLLDHLQDQRLVEALFAGAEADRVDTQTELGGVLDWQNDRLVAVAYEPMMKSHDQVFYPPPEMIEHLYTGLAHYHFHAQAYRHGAFAAPGKGDRGFADRTGFHCVVLTFIDRDRLNVDAYHPGGVVIDLGTLARR